MRVLIVEDEPKMARILRRGLEQEGYAVDSAADGQDGLHLATENDYDAVILDLMLPIIDGIEVCRAMRERGRWAPVILLTARDAVPDRVRGLDAGADDYLVKPFSFEELLARLRSLVRRGVRDRPTVVTAGPVALDPSTHRVAHSGDAVTLTPKEYALLELLMRHAGQVMSRTRILEHVWSYNAESGSNVVDVTVKTLRRKLDAPQGTQLIKTVRGAGYIFDAEDER